MHARLGRNRGRYHGESIIIDAVQAELHEAARAFGWACDTFLSRNDLTLRAYHRPAQRSSKRVYISSGIHGDEPSGPLALRQMLRENAWPDLNYWIVPCLNPGGFRLATRENHQGIDLNRDYRHLRSAEIAAHVAWLERQPQFDLSLILHEDWEAGGFYVYELNPEQRPSLAEPMIEAVRPFFPIETTETVDSFPCQGGIIRPQVQPQDRPEWAEAIYLLAHKSPQSYTIETSSDYPLETRVQTHVRAVREAIRFQPQFTH